MNRDERIIYLFFRGEPVRKLSAQFNLSYARVYQIVSNAQDEMAELRKEVSSLKSQLENERYEIKRLKEQGAQVNEVTAQLEQSKVDNIKLLIRLNRLKKKVKLLERELEESREENKDRLRQDSKVLGWEAWGENV